MLDGLKRLLRRGPAATSAQPWDEVVKWSSAQQAQFRPLKDDAGFMIDGRSAAVPWRLEWGVSQRPYVRSSELRIRAEVTVPGSIQALVLNQALQVSMEKSVFDQYIEGVQTRIDDQTPPEMRWLVMFPKLSAQDLGPLDERFVAVAPSRSWMKGWMAAGLTEALLAAPEAPDRPFVLMVTRGRMTLRTGLDEPTPAALAASLKLFTAAIRAAPREAMPDSAMPSTQPGLFAAGSPSAEDDPGR